MNINVKYTVEDIKNLIRKDLTSKGLNIIKQPELIFNNETKGYGLNEKQESVFKGIEVNVELIKNNNN